MFFDKEWYNRNYPYGSIHSSRSFIINEHGYLEEKPNCEKKKKKHWFRFRKKKKEKDTIASKVRSLEVVKENERLNSNKKCSQKNENENISYKTTKPKKKSDELVRPRQNGNEHMSRRARKAYNKSRLKSLENSPGEVNNESLKYKRKKNMHQLGPIINKSSDGKLMRLKIHNYDEPVPDYIRCSDRTCEHSEDEGRNTSWFRRKKDKQFIVNQVRVSEENESEEAQTTATDSDVNKSSKSTLNNESEGNDDDLNEETDFPSLEPMGNFWYNILNMIVNKGDQESVKEVSSEPIPKKVSKKISFADDTSQGDSVAKLNSKVKSKNNSTFPRSGIMRNSSKSTSYQIPSIQNQVETEARAKSSEQLINVEHYDQHESKDKVYSPTHSGSRRRSEKYSSASEIEDNVKEDGTSLPSTKKRGSSSEIKYMARKEGTLKNIKKAKPSISTNSSSREKYKARKEGTLKNVKKAASASSTSDSEIEQEKRKEGTFKNIKPAVSDSTNSTLEIVICEETSEEETTSITTSEDEDTGESSQSYRKTTFISSIKEFFSNFYNRMNLMFSSNHRMK